MTKQPAVLPYRGKMPAQRVSVSMVEALYSLDGQEVPEGLRLDGRHTVYHLVQAAEKYRILNGYDNFRIVINNPVTFKTIYRSK